MTVAAPSSLDGHAVALPRIAPGAIGSAVNALRPGQRLVLVGAERHGVGEALRAASMRGALMLAPADGRGAPMVLRHLLDDLAELALARWPDWPGRDGGPWMRAASRLAAGGRAPRFRRADVGLDFDGLRRIAAPDGLVLLAEVDPTSPNRARAMVDSLEWCAARGTPTVALLPCRPPAIPPYDRLLYDARDVRDEPVPLRDRFIAASALPHHASPTERRVKEALDRDPELAPLFACNQTVALPEGRCPRVDLLWREGRIVVELDGPDHQAAPKFADDRHRDYELLVAGYHVLRITNDQVATDLQRAVEKIRAVVRLRGSEGRRT